MLKRHPTFKLTGQAAIEYLLLLGAVMALVLIGLKTYLPQTNTAAEAYYNTVIEKGLMLNQQGDGCPDGWCADAGGICQSSCDADPSGLIPGL